MAAAHASPIDERDTGAMITVGVAGLTHLGIVTAAGLAARGGRVIAWDPDPERADRLAGGEVIVSEPDLPELIERHRERLIFTPARADLAEADLVYIAADVPTDEAGNSRLDGIQALVDTVTEALHSDAVLTILCQVPPGFTRRQTMPPERLFYQVETLIFGRAVERACRPERYIIGCADPNRPLPLALSEVLAAGGCPILPMRYESAELAKIAINCFLVAQVATTNTLAEICEAIGADWSEIAPALRLDRRIGPHAYLAPGLGIAGGNLERDLATVGALSRAQATEAGIVDAWRVNSEWRKNWLVRRLDDAAPRLPENPLIAVLGLAYKVNTDSIKNSASIALLHRLAGQRVRAHDPAVPADAAPEGVEVTSSALQACEGADALVIATPWPEYRNLDIGAIAARMAGRVLIDPFGILAGQNPSGRGFEWVRLGVSESPTTPDT
jgi:UDPglucose 6-dehydrogenase